MIVILENLKNKLTLNRDWLKWNQIDYFHLNIWYIPSRWRVEHILKLNDNLSCAMFCASFSVYSLLIYKNSTKKTKSIMLPKGLILNQSRKWEGGPYNLLEIRSWSMGQCFSYYVQHNPNDFKVDIRKRGIKATIKLVSLFLEQNAIT